MYIYVHLYISIYIYLNLYTSMYIYLHLCTCLYIYVHLYTFIYIYMRLYTFLHTHIYIYTYIYTPFISIYIYTHMCFCMHACCLETDLLSPNTQPLPAPHPTHPLPASPRRQAQAHPVNGSAPEDDQGSRGGSHGVAQLQPATTPAGSVSPSRK